MKARLVVVGSSGRMGQAILRLAREGGFEVVGGVDSENHSLDCINQADAVIDFSHHSVTMDVVRTCVSAKKPLVIGTTGHCDQDRQAIQQAAKDIPLIFSANYSVGVNLLFHLTKQVAEILGDAYDQEIIEIHHRMKKDSPSGTARQLAEILCKVKKESYAENTRQGRVGDVGPRTSNEIGVHAVRGGDVVGEHTVLFAGIGERIELMHKASSRDTFAAGALRAAKWLIARAPGFYEMADVLEL